MHRELGMLSQANVGDVVHYVHAPPMGKVLEHLLALGAGFIPDHNVHRCISVQDVHASFKDFAWRMRWRWLFRNSPDTPVPRFFVRSNAIHGWRMKYPNKRIALVFRALERWVKARVEHARSRYDLLPRNLPKPAYGVLSTLRNHPDLIIRRADKNMGICVVSRKWYGVKCRDHLNNLRNFVELSEADSLELQRGARHQNAVLLHELNSWLKHVPGRSNHRFAGYFKFLRRVTDRDCLVPHFYGLVKIHKSPPALRPIVACHSWLTTPWSQVCAHELHALIRRHLPHVLADSKSLVRMVEDVHVPLSHSVDSVVLVTGDVEGLYVNIPIDDAIAACVTFVAQHEGYEFADMIRAWLTFVFRNALTRFGERHFLQKWGFAMGTAAAPDAANVYMALCEDLHGVYTAEALRSVLPDGSSLLLFARLIDDYTIIVSGEDDSLIPSSRRAIDSPVVRAITKELDRRVEPYLKIEWKVSTASMDTLDLHVYKGCDFIRSRKLSYRTHQKLGNRYTYLPFLSRHAPGVTPSVVKSEVMRNAVNCSTFADFRHMVQLYVVRQLHRGFPKELLYKWVAEVAYDMRERVLHPAQRVVGNRRCIPLYLKLQYDLVSSGIEAPWLLYAASHALLVRGVEQFWDRMLVCWTRSRSLGSMILSSSDATNTD